MQWIFVKLHQMPHNLFGLSHCRQTIKNDFGNCKILRGILLRFFFHIQEYYKTISQRRPMFMGCSFTIRLQHFTIQFHIINWHIGTVLMQ